MAMLAIIGDGCRAFWYSAGLSSVIQFAKGGYWNPPGAGDRQHEQRRSARFCRDSLRLHQRDRQQRQRVRGNQCEHALVQPDAGAGDADRPLPVPASRCWRSREVWRRKKEFRLPVELSRPHGPLFVGLLVGTVVIVGALTFFPALSLGPIVEHYLMQSGKLFSIDAVRHSELPREHHCSSEPAARDPTSLLPKKLAQSRPLFDPQIVKPRDEGNLRQAESRHAR